MEFFKYINIQTTEDQLRKILDFENLSLLSTNIFLMNSNSNIAQIGGIWGDFSLQKDFIRGGVRFSLLECPNALSFTFTTGYPPEPKQIVLHLTINRKTISKEFTEEIEDFMLDWKEGFEKRTMLGIGSVN